MNDNNMTRKDLARVIHEKIGFSQRGAGELVDTVFACMRKSLLEKESIKLVQFGTFKVKAKAPRMGRNPRTGEAMEICERSMVSFKSSKKLKERINR